MIKRNSAVQKKLDDQCAALIGATRHSFDGLKPSDIPMGPGVYVISERMGANGDEEDILYVGQSKSLSDRIFKKHKNGSERNSVFHKHLTANLKSARSESINAKDYIQTHCLVRWLEIGSGLDGVSEVDRLRLESYLVAVLAPKFGLRVGPK